MQRKLALFDLDHTLLPIDSDFEWGAFLGRQGVVDAETYRRTNEHFYEQYKAGTLDMLAFLEFALHPLASHERPVLDRLHAQYMQEVILPNIQPSAQALVNQHLHAGDLCAIVTATNAFVTGPIAHAFGIPHLIATVPEQQQDQNGSRFTGKVRGTPCFREGKIERVEMWLESMGYAWTSFASTTFYSDSRNDLPLLERVTHPVATNADETLLAVAEQRGWRTLALHSRTLK